MQKYYFFDRGILQGMALSGVEIHPVKGEKLSKEPLFTEEREATPSKPWEVRYDNSYPNVIWDAKEGIYKLFYTLIIEDSECENTPIAARPGKVYHPRDDRRCAVAYAQSKDGIRWEKPNLGIVSFQGSTNNNLLIEDAHGGGVLLDEEDADPNRRYKMVALKDHPGQRSQMSVSFSPDGIHWSSLQPWTDINPWGDTHNLPFLDLNDRKYKVVTREWKHNQRVATICESQDFIHWSNEKTVLKGEGYGDQVYSMPIFYYNGLYLGLASIFHEGDRLADNFDTVDCELTYTNNPDDFHFVAHGEPFIQRGKGEYPNGEFDCGCIYASPPIFKNGKLYFYYMGGNGQHTNFRETSFGCIVYEEDKLAYIEPSQAGTEGIVKTANFECSSDNIQILADFKNIEDIQCAILDKWDGQVMPGFDFEDCSLKSEENGWMKLIFKGQVETLKNQKICFCFKLKDTRLYAIRGDLKLVNAKY